ncbi:MAG: BatA domain-containing protein [Pirellulaceae bacterium]
MAFVNISLLAGGLLAAIPIILHLILRQQPKRITFPAIRFVRQRHDSNRRQLQLRHWFLLLLRCAAIGVLALALARPTAVSSMTGKWLVVGLLVPVIVVVGALTAVAVAQRKGKWLIVGLAALFIVLLLGASALAVTTLAGSPPLLGDEQSPVAAALVFDVSPRMEYRHQNQTRLDAAKETALWLVKQFPVESQAAVVESHPGPAFFAVDLAAASTSIERMRTTGVPEPLDQSVQRALDLVLTSDKPRKEIYLFTDTTAAAWPRERLEALRSSLAAHPGVLCYWIDVGAEQPRNYSLGALELSTQSLVKNGELVVTADIRSQNAGGTVTVELLIEAPDPSLPLVVDGQTRLPEAQVRDRKTVTLAASESQRLSFLVRGWDDGTYQGTLRFLQDDGLKHDNERYFAIEARDAWPILLVSPANANSFLLAEALAPREQRETDSARFDCRSIAQTELADQQLSGFSVVCLLNPQPLTTEQWDQLTRYVERGGNLFVSLGHNAQPVTAFHEPAAQRLLGGRLARQWRAVDREIFLNPQRLDHPALAFCRAEPTGIPWYDSPVFRHWTWEDRVPEADSVINFSNGQPAFLEQPFGEGRVVAVATPIAEESHPRGRRPWNELLTSENPWPQFVLVNEWMRYLASGQESRLNYLTGETAMLANDTARHPARYQLFTPLEEPQDIVARDGAIVIPFTDFPGAYRLKGQRDGPRVRGFAVNLPAGFSDLARLPRAQLEEGLGEDTVRYARSRDEIVFEVGEARVGREFYPYLLLVLAIVLGLEHLLANRFYPK